LRKRRTTTEILGFVEDPRKGYFIAVLLECLEHYEDCIAIPAAPEEELAKLDEDDYRFLQYLAKQHAYEKRQELEEIKRLWSILTKNQ